MEVVIFYDKEAEWYKQCMSEPEMDCRLYFRPWEKVYENEWLEEGGPSLAAVVVKGAAGMNCCHEIRKRSRELPVLWVSDQEGFLAESRRIPVQEFWTQPVSCRLLKRIIQCMLAEYRKSRPPG